MYGTVVNLHWEYEYLVHLHRGQLCSINKNSTCLFQAVRFCLLIALIYNDRMTGKVPDSDKDRLISMSEAAEIYGFNPDYLARLARKGRLKAQKVGWSWVTTPADVEKFIASRQKKGAYRNDIQID